LLKESLISKPGLPSFLTSYEVATILLVLGFIAFVAELFIPGFGVAGIIGMTCFALYFAGGFLAGHTEWWSALVFIIGLVLVAIEIIVPGFGVFGITGIIALLVGVVFAAPTLGQGVGSFDRPGNSRHCNNRIL